MSTVVNIAQFQCTVKSSFETIENTFYRRFSHSENPESDIAVSRVLDVWHEKLKQEFAATASEELFYHAINTCLDTYFAMLSDSERKSLKVVDLAVIRGVFCDLIDGYLQMGVFDNMSS